MTHKGDFRITLPASSQASPGHPILVITNASRISTPMRISRRLCSSPRRKSVLRMQLPFKCRPQRDHKKNTHSLGKPCSLESTSVFREHRRRYGHGSTQIPEIVEALSFSPLFIHLQLLYHLSTISLSFQQCQHLILRCRSTLYHVNIFGDILMQPYILKKKSCI